MPSRIEDFELVVNDGTPTVPQWLRNFPNKVQFNTDGCSSDRFVIINLERPQERERWGQKKFTGPIFEELEFWLDGEQQSLFLMLLLSPQPGFEQVVVGALAGRYVGPRQICREYVNGESDVQAVLAMIANGLRAKGILVDKAPVLIEAIVDIPAHMDFRA